MDCPYYGEGLVRWCGATELSYIPSIREVVRNCTDNFCDCIHHEGKSLLQKTDGSCPNAASCPQPSRC